MGLAGINTLEQMARVKSVVPETVRPGGFAILNAEDDLVYNMKDDLKCNVAFFSMDENNPRIKKHCKGGGYAVVYENGYVTILKGTWKIRVLKVTDIPITFDGKALHNIMNTLPAVLAAYLFREISIEDIRTGLSTFIPSPALTPGRLNVFEFKKCKFIVDFAHNPAGLDLLGNFVSKMEGSPKIGIISGTGDRRDDDIRELGRLSAKYFDEIIIRCDKNLRGRTAEEIVNLLVEGINEAKTKEIPIEIIYKEPEAIVFAYKNAKPGSLITIMCDVVSEALDFIKELKAKEDAGLLV
jgi:cyanophycin synthetase